MRIRKLALTALLIGTLCAPAFAQNNAAPPPGVSNLLLLPPAERYPRIRAAIGQLEEARNELKAAPHDFGGHKVEAIRAIDEAIRQLREALKYAK